MIILPAIDLYDGCAVRLFRGDYARMTVYSRDPAALAAEFGRCGAEYIHVVDLQGARDGGAPNLEVLRRIAASGSCRVEAGGGVRSFAVLEDYLAAGVSRVILGTAAVEDEEFLRQAAARWGDALAVSADIRDGRVAVRGWRETSALGIDAFFTRLAEAGVRTVVCTDISRDGAMAGTNLPLYRELRRRYALNVIASGGVSSLSDVEALRDMGLYGAIIGKAYYEGAIDLQKAIEVAR